MTENNDSIAKYCILETVDEKGEYSCFSRDYDLWCPFATLAGIEKYDCRSGCGVKARGRS